MIFRRRFMEICLELAINALKPVNLIIPSRTSVMWRTLAGVPGAQRIPVFQEMAIFVISITVSVYGVRSKIPNKEN